MFKIINWRCLMELLQMQYFLSIARFESVTQAAAFHHVPQSAMSQTLARLEKELGCKLFERKNNRIYLNRQGQIFLEAVEKAFSAIENGKRELNEIIDDISGPVSILVIENHRFIVHCVSEFSKSYPQVSFKISHVYNTEQTYDLCISSENHFGTMDEAIPLISEKIILAVHEDHPLASSESISIRNLKNEKFITTGMHSALYNLTRQSCLDAGFEPNISIMCDDPYFVRKYISNNLGLALAPSVTWAGRFRENTKVIPITDPEIITTSYLLFDKHRYLSPAVKKFREFCCEESLKIEGNLLLDN